MITNSMFYILNVLLIGKEVDCCVVLRQRGNLSLQVTKKLVKNVFWRVMFDKFRLLLSIGKRTYSPPIHIA